MEAKKSEINLDSINNKKFWNDFTNKNLLPPMIYNENDENSIEEVVVQFKSFGFNYFNWLFHKDGFTDLYKIFISKSGEKLFKGFIRDYKLKEDDQNFNFLVFYVEKLPQLYLNNIQLPPIDASFSEEKYDNILGPEYDPENYNSVDYTFTRYINEEKNRRKRDRKHKYIETRSSDEDSNGVAPSFHYYNYNSSSSNEKEE